MKVLQYLVASIVKRSGWWAEVDIQKMRCTGKVCTGK